MWQTDDRQIRKMLDKLRKMSKWQRIIVRSWLNDWYDYEKQQEREEE